MTQSVKIVFAKYFGDDNDNDNRKYMIFNLSPKELWIDSNKYENFRQLIYHFRGRRI
ncbi:hypothetical protein [Prevotella sp. HCN-7019]|uniref:hypothetical protein n=1 Tax=Prevotella sp. HCN-7019 TaxID=3134668 RepID=UPI0030C622A1